MLRLPLALALASALGAGQPTQQPTARVEGRMVSTTGEPLAKVSLRLAPDRSISAEPQIGRPPTFDAVSAADGSFKFEDLSPGNYVLAANKGGYVTGRYSQILIVKPGEVLKELVFKLTPQVTITGRVTDQDGDAVANAAITVNAIAYFNDLLVLAGVPRTPNLMSDDQGTFRIANIEPGRYYISAQVAPSPKARVVSEVDVPTYYPSAIDLRDAKLVDATGGGEIRRIDIRLRRTLVFSISGKLLEADGSPALDAGVAAIPIGDVMPSPWQILSKSAISKDGTFEIRNLPPGTYDLDAMRGRLIGADVGLSGIRQMYVEPQSTGGLARNRVSIGASNLSDVVLSLAPPIEIKATVNVEGGSALPNNPSMKLVDASGITLNSPTVPLKAEGEFVIKGLAPSQYLLDVRSLPEGFYLKALYFADKDVTHTPLDLTHSAGGKLEILLSPNGAEITGAAPPNVLVTLWPKVPDAGNFMFGSRNTQTDDSGKFSLKSLAPGEYYIAAWESGDKGLLQSPGFVSQFDTAGASSLKLDEGAKKSVKLDSIPADKIAAAVSKLK